MSLRRSTTHNKLDIFWEASIGQDIHLIAATTKTQISVCLCVVCSRCSMQTHCAPWQPAKVVWIELRWIVCEMTVTPPAERRGVASLQVGEGINRKSKQMFRAIQYGWNISRCPCGHPLEPPNSFLLWTQICLDNNVWLQLVLWQLKEKPPNGEKDVETQTKKISKTWPKEVKIAGARRANHAACWRACHLDRSNTRRFIIVLRSWRKQRAKRKNGGRHRRGKKTQVSARPYLPLSRHTNWEL